MDWSELTTPNEYGECAATEILKLADLFKAYLDRRFVKPELERGRFVSQVLEYVRLRKRARYMEISVPHHEPYYPANWYEEDETVWRDWINFHCTLESWHDEIMTPLFGEREYLWETDGWRDELIQFLPWWIQRSMEVVDNFDGTQEECEVDDGEVDPHTSKVDPYLMDHGSSKQRKGLYSVF